MDKYRLDIKERFKKSGNLYAYQSILARLLETVRKGYWKADKKRVDQMLLQFNETIREAGSTEVLKHIVIIQQSIQIRSPAV